MVTGIGSGGDFSHKGISFDPDGMRLPSLLPSRWVTCFTALIWVKACLAISNAVLLPLQPFSIHMSYDCLRLVTRRCLINSPRSPSSYSPLSHQRRSSTSKPDLLSSRFSTLCREFGNENGRSGHLRCFR